MAQNCKMKGQWYKRSQLTKHLKRPLNNFTENKHCTWPRKPTNWHMEEAASGCEDGFIQKREAAFYGGKYKTTLAENLLKVMRLNTGQPEPHKQNCNGAAV